VSALKGIVATVAGLVGFALFVAGVCASIQNARVEERAFVARFAEYRRAHACWPVGASRGAETIAWVCDDDSTWTVPTENSR
jgi:hypothetical protein